MQVHKNSVKWLQTFPYNIDKIFCKDSSKNPDLKLLEFYGRFFSKNLHFQRFLVKKVSSKVNSFYGLGLPLWHLHWISGLR